MFTPKRLVVVAGAAALAASTTPVFAWLSAYAQIDPAQAGGAQPSDVQLAMELAARIKAEISTKPETVSVEDLEAIIVFIAGQGNYSDVVIASALDQVEVGASPRLIQATENARQTLLKRKRRGTGTIGQGFGGFSAFTPPGGNPGGGGSGYAD